MIVIPIPFCDPVQVFAPFAEQAWAMLLDGAAPHGDYGRHAYIAVDPVSIVTAHGDGVVVDGNPVPGDPFTILAEQLACHKPGIPPGNGPAPFGGGAIGFFGYELGRHLERAPSRHRQLPDHPDMAFGIYDVVVAFDLAARKAWVIAATPWAVPKAEKLASRLIREMPRDLPKPVTPPLNWVPEMTRDEYLAKVARIVDYIHAGDVFQVNLTQRVLAARPQGFSPFQAYRKLRAANPAPFAAFLRCGDDFTIASASPERFLSLSADGLIQARPIKGTMERDSDAAIDRENAMRLAASPKDRAENLMITDLLRNDIGRNAQIGSVAVKTLAGIESFASLHHLVSVIEGRLKPGLGPLDLVRGAFPGGSITGAPKVRAMEIIDELEIAPRGPYCGSVAWIGFDGAMDANIVIRTIVMTQHHIIAQAGGGIVADSSPEAEYAEMLAKVRPALTALA